MPRKISISDSNGDVVWQLDVPEEAQDVLAFLRASDDSRDWDAEAGAYVEGGYPSRDWVEDAKNTFTADSAWDTARGAYAPCDTFTATLLEE